MCWVHMISSGTTKVEARKPGGSETVRADGSAHRTGTDCAGLGAFRE